MVSLHEFVSFALDAGEQTAYDNVTLPPRKEPLLLIGWKPGLTPNQVWFTMKIRKVLPLKRIKP